MRNIKKDPVTTAMSALCVLVSVASVAALPTGAQPNQQGSLLAKAPRGEAQDTQQQPPPRQNFGPPRGRPDNDGKAVGPMLGDMLSTLKLDGKQQAELNTLMDNERTQMDALHQQIRQLHQKTRGGIDSLLTAAQRQQLTQMEKAMAENHPGGPPPCEGFGPPPGEGQDGPGDYPQ